MTQFGAKSGNHAEQENNRGTSGRYFQPARYHFAPAPLSNLATERRLIFEMDIGELLAGAVAGNKAGVQFPDRPGRREAAGSQTSLF
jgi:hypothetical protein